ncbi:5-oxoprolinase subunit PxpB [Tundrisphaera sp. TA3]|uniref:5-oxoprolinase subunit PxpB n=1 Tax=Tundrisphaera sp. TA3 TaxID=3435775 RepID=UPI003EBEE284
MIDLTPLGDRAFLARFATESEAQAWGEAVRRRGWPGVIEVTVAYASAAVFADSDRVDLEALERVLRTIEPGPTISFNGRLIRVPVLYDGPDLGEVAGRVGLPHASLIEEHSGRDYKVYAIGFQPGFPYAGYLEGRLAGLPRLASPRPRVPAGSVAIAGRQTGIYPRATPGGWLLLGRTPARIVDLERGEFPIRVGDRLRFEPIGPGAYRDRLGEGLVADETEG